jgi:hypothetical protein
MDEMLKILRDLFKGRVYRFEIPNFIYWFLFDQKQEESSHELSNECPNELPWTISREQTANTDHHA